MSKRKSHEDREPAREFPNLFLDYDGKQHLINANGKVSNEFASELQKHIDHLLHRLKAEYNESTIDYRDYTVYTGVSGVALLYFHLYSKLDGSTDSSCHLQTAVSYIDSAIRQLRRRGVSFLCGDAGPLALGAVIYSRLDRSLDCTSCIDRLLSLGEQVLADSSLPDELLFGRCGYLFALMFVRHHLGTDVIPSSIVKQVCTTVLESGRVMARAQKSGSALMYEWHGKKYLGAAHGLAGILHTLLMVDDASLKTELQNCIRPTLDFLMTLRFPSGNYPSSIGSSGGDLLIHWCHGAPGWIHMFAMAYKVLGDTKYLNAVKDCAEVLWKRGILQKGYGICHGVAGNAYGFLVVYQLTGDMKYLYRAMKFAEWCFDYGKHGCRTPDRPYSLFEGLAGTIYFLVDLLDPQNARFPAFQL